MIFNIYFLKNAHKTTIFCPLGVWNHRNIESRDTWRPTNRRSNCII